jgi:hypothetical protein
MAHFEQGKPAAEGSPRDRPGLVGSGSFPIPATPEISAGVNTPLGNMLSRPIQCHESTEDFFKSQQSTFNFFGHLRSYCCHFDL